MIKMLHFTQGEKRAVLILMILILVFIGIYSSFNFFTPAGEVEIRYDTIYKKMPVKARDSRAPRVPLRLTEETWFDLNRTDTTQLKRIPGIGPVFAQRIVEYRTWLGGYYSLDQLQEVNGIGEARLRELKKWLYVRPGSYKLIDVNSATFNELNNHIYFNISLIRPIKELQEAGVFIKNIDELERIYPYKKRDITRLSPYLTFESEEVDGSLEPDTP